jgi:hypothetical protein
MDLEYLANETGGEVLANKPAKLDTTFQTLIDHLRSRYNLAFVSTNKQRDGTRRKLKLDLDPARQNRKANWLSKPDAIILRHAVDIWVWIVRVWCSRSSCHGERRTRCQTWFLF